mgnify:CR=1 FL=1
MTLAQVYDYRVRRPSPSSRTRVRHADWTLTLSLPSRRRAGLQGRALLRYDSGRPRPRVVVRKTGQARRRKVRRRGHGRQGQLGSPRPPSRLLSSALCLYPPSRSPPHILSGPPISFVRDPRAAPIFALTTTSCLTCAVWPARAWGAHGRDEGRGRAHNGVSLRRSSQTVPTPRVIAPSSHEALDRCANAPRSSRITPHRTRPRPTATDPSRRFPHSTHQPGVRPTPNSLCRTCPQIAGPRSHTEPSRRFSSLHPLSPVSPSPISPHSFNPMLSTLAVVLLGLLPQAHSLFTITCPRPVRRSPSPAQPNLD